MTHKTKQINELFFVFKSLKYICVFVFIGQILLWLVIIALWEVIVDKADVIDVFRTDN